MHAALHWLLGQLCARAAGAAPVAAGVAVAAFCRACAAEAAAADGGAPAPAAVPPPPPPPPPPPADGAALSPEQRASLVAAWVAPVYSHLCRHIDQWTDAAALPARRAAVGRIVGRARPHLLLMVEHNEGWRAGPLPLAAGRSFVAAQGRGMATIVYDGATFEPASSSDLRGVTLPPFIRSLREQGEGDEGAAPKSSCVVPLRRRDDSALLLAAVLHLESGAPSDSAKVRFRAAQLRASLSELQVCASAAPPLHLRCTSVAPPLYLPCASTVSPPPA
jgi:hypothetical protein